MKIGMVLEGGGMRGLFTCGIIDVLMENNLYVDGVIGVSAGAAFGCNYKSKQIGRPIRYNKRFSKDPRYTGIRSLLTTGDLYNAKFCYEDMITIYDPWDQKSFVENPMEFYTVSTDIETGEPYYHHCGEIQDLNTLHIRASASMPVVSRPVEINGHKYLDGGISDSIPLKKMESLGYDKIIVIETQPYEYIKHPQKLLWAIKLFYHNYPNVTKRMANRHTEYNAQKEYVKEKEKKGEILVLRPKQSLNIASAETDPNELERVYQIGRALALEKLDEIRNYICVNE